MKTINEYRVVCGLLGGRSADRVETTAISNVTVCQLAAYFVLVFCGGCGPSLEERYLTATEILDHERVRALTASLRLEEVEGEIRQQARMQMHRDISDELSHIDEQYLSRDGELQSLTVDYKAPTSDSPEEQQKEKERVSRLRHEIYAERRELSRVRREWVKLREEGEAESGTPQYARLLEMNVAAQAAIDRHPAKVALDEANNALKLAEVNVEKLRRMRER